MKHNYKYYVATRVDGEPYKIIAASTYAGKPVKGSAICAKGDTFSMEKGKELAAARCNEKVAEKRLKRAKEKLEEALVAAEQAEKHLSNMQNYHSDSLDALMDARREVKNLLLDM